MKTKNSLKNTKKKRICPYPFAQVTTTPTGQFKLCCSSSEAYGSVSDFPGKFTYSVGESGIREFWSSPYMKWVRENHKKGVSIKECHACFIYEKNGSESYRQRAIKELGVYEEPLKLPKSLDLKLGNKCNASCLFCDPSSSSRILKEWKDIGWDKAPPFNSGLTGWVTPELFDVDYGWADNPSFWEELKGLSSKITNLKFTGGEPLINNYMVRYLDYLVGINRARHIRLQVTTNGIVVPNKFLNLIARFREVEINFSVDGYGKQNEYIRYPVNWNLWLKNIEKVRQSVGHHVKMYFQHSVSVYSVWGLVEYFRWMWPYKEFGFHLFHVFHPEMQQPDVLSKTEAEKVVVELEGLYQELSGQAVCRRDEILLEEIQGIINLLSKLQDKSHLKPKLKKYIEVLDKHRGLSIKEYIPCAAKSLGF